MLKPIGSSSFVPLQKSDSRTNAEKSSQSEKLESKFDRIKRELEAGEYKIDLGKTASAMAKSLI